MTGGVPIRLFTTEGQAQYTGFTVVATPMIMFGFAGSYDPAAGGTIVGAGLNLTGRYVADRWVAAVGVQGMSFQRLDADRQTYHHGMSPRFEAKRTLGRTGFLATAIGQGDLADRSVTIAQCIATTRRALEAGVNVLDTAPNYEAGYSEEILGRAVREHLAAHPTTCSRDDLFLITKIDQHDKPIAPQVEASLQRLGLNHMDLFVFHGLSSVTGWQKVMQASCDAGIAGLLQQRELGRLYFMGLSSHDPDTLLAALPTGLIDVAMFPIGPFADARYEQRVLPMCREHHVGSICFKTFGAGKLLADTEGYQQPLMQRPRGKVSSGGTPAPGKTESPGSLSRTLPRLTVEQCLRYTLTVEPDVALLGLSFPNEQDQAWAVAERFLANPDDPDHGRLGDLALQSLREDAARAIEGKGRVWWNPQPIAG